LRSAVWLWAEAARAADPPAGIGPTDAALPIGMETANSAVHTLRLTAIARLILEARPFGANAPFRSRRNGPARRAPRGRACSLRFLHKLWAQRL